VWPFADQARQASEPRRVDAVTRIVSPNVVTSPVSGRKAAFVHIELVEEQSLGAVVVGDVVSLDPELPGVLAIDLVVRRASLHLVSLQGGGTPIDVVPPELTPLLRHATGGVICVREHLVLQGEKVRLRAVLEPVGGGKLVVRDDLGAVELHEVVDVSAP
jgi:hypothetical protein